MLQGRRIASLLAVALFVALVPTVAHAAPPSNDLRESAVALTAPVDVTVDLAEATTSAGDPECYGSHRNIWFSVTTDKDQALLYQILDENFDHVAAVFGVNDDGSFTRLACDDYDDLRWEAEQGVTYLVMVGTYHDSLGGTARLKLLEQPGPRNDDIRLAQPVHNLPFHKRIDVFGATGQANDPDCYGGENSVWFSFTPKHDDNYVASTMGSSYNTAMGIYTGSVGGLKKVFCSEDTGRSDDVRSRFLGKKGTRYLIMVAAQGTWGTLDFSLQRVLQTKITLDGAGLVHSVTGAARVTGTFWCNEASRVRITGSLRQRHGAELTTWNFSVTRDCSRKTKSWSVVLAPEYDAFTPGEAALSASAYAWVAKENDASARSRLVSMSACRCEWGL